MKRAELKNVVKKITTKYGKARIYLDLDGTAAKWRTDQELKELYPDKTVDEILRMEDYFLKLPEAPYLQKLKEVKDAYPETEVIVLSNYLTDGNAIDQKIKWCEEHIPYADEQIYVSYGQDKAAAALRHARLNKFPENVIILNDHTKNCRDALGRSLGLVIKVLNGVNGTSGNWKGLVDFA